MRSSSRTSRKPRHEATKQEIYEGILHMIMTNELGQGQRLVEEALAKAYDVSRTPVREALFALEKDGIIERSHACGARVATFTPDDVEQIYEVRKALECCALSKAVRSLSFTVLLQLKHDLEQAGRETGVQCSHRQKEVDTKLHTMIVVAGGNRRLISYYENISLLANSLKLISYRDEEHAREIGAQHSAIVEALLHRDAEQADKLLRQHIEDGCRNAIEVFFQQHHEPSRGAAPARQRIRRQHAR